MSEIPDKSPEPIPAAVPVAVAEQKPHRLNVIAAWVGIAAGVVVIVAVIFGTGFMVGAHSGGHHGGGGSDRHHGRFDEGRGGPPMWGPGGMGGPGFERGPGQLPQPPAGSSAPSPPTR